MAETFTILRDDEVKATGLTETEVMRWFHLFPYSMNHAIKHEGYRVLSES